MHDSVLHVASVIVSNVSFHFLQIFPMNVVAIVLSTAIVLSFILFFYFFRISLFYT